MPGAWGYLGALAVSLPLYVCATGSVPIAAALMAKGLSPGGALVFLVAGPATNAASLGVVKKIAGGRGLWVYLAVIVLGSLSMGALLDAVGVAGVRAAAGPVSEAPGVFEWLSLAALLGLYAYSRLAPLFKGPEPEPSLSLRVEGMSCRGCARRVEEALSKLEGVEGVWVDLSRGLVKVKGRVRAEEAARAVREAGYRVREP